MLGRGIWCERTVDEDRAARLLAGGAPSSLSARILASRGIEVEDLAAFLDPSVRRLASPDGLPGVAEAVRIILPFVRDRRKIVVYGDYDVDGVCASAILVSTLRRLGATADAFIPDRFREGFGMTTASIDRLFREHPDLALVITVDNGITAIDEIARIRSRGITVIVTDHHLPPLAPGSTERTVLPGADALIDPKVAAGPEHADLCGAGVAFFLANALVAALREEAVAQGLLKPGERLSGSLIVLAGLATITDQVVLRGQNRLLVIAALESFWRAAPVGLRELHWHSARRPDPLKPRDFSFGIGPRLNASGRMDSARLSYDLLMTDDREAARELVVKIEAFNAARKTTENQMAEEARAQMEAQKGNAALVVADSRRPDGSPKWNPGIAGIVAARLLETVQVPVAVVTEGHGSARVPPGYNVRRLLDAAADALARYGGHAAAGGFTVKPGRLDDFQRLFCLASAACRAESAEDAAAVPFDGWLEPAALTLDLCEEIQRLEPFGEGNPEPVFGLRGVTFKSVEATGQGRRRHASFTFTRADIPCAVWWGHGDAVGWFCRHREARFDILFTLAMSDFHTRHVELRIVAIRPA